MNDSAPGTRVASVFGNQPTSFDLPQVRVCRDCTADVLKGFVDPILLMTYRGFANIEQISGRHPGEIVQGHYHYCRTPCRWQRV